MMWWQAEEHDKCKPWGDDAIMCDKTCKCQGKKNDRVRAFQIVDKYDSNSKVKWEGVRFSNGSGVIRFAYYDDSQDFEQTTSFVTDLDKYLKQSGFTNSSYAITWTD